MNKMFIALLVLETATIGTVVVTAAQMKKKNKGIEKKLSDIQSNITDIHENLNNQHIDVHKKLKALQNTIYGYCSVVTGQDK